MCRPPPRPSPLRSWRVQPTPHAAWTYRTGGTSHVCVCGVRARGEGGHRGQPLCSAQGPVVVCAVCVALDIYSHVWAPSTRTAPSSLISHAAVWGHVTAGPPRMAASASAARPVLSVAVSCSRLVEPGDTASYREYRIDVAHDDASWHAWRRYSQFSALRDALGSSSDIPFPPKGVLTWHATSELTAAERVRTLGTWLAAVVSREELAASPSLLCFLGLASTLPAKRSVHVRSITNAESGESGDLVLFRTRAAVPALQRAVTRSRWDHVGILLFVNDERCVCRSAECGLCGEVGVLECNSAGTRFYPLRGYEREWYTLYEEIALRPLLWPGRGTAAGCALLQRWYGRVADAPYLLTISKIWAGQHRLPEPPEPDAADDDDVASQAEEEPAPDGFFCSELVAHCYQELGVLQSERPASGYWPVDFGETAGKKLPLSGGVALGEELPIEFETPAVDAIL